MYIIKTCDKRVIKQCSLHAYSVLITRFDNAFFAMIRVCYANRSFKKIDTSEVKTATRFDNFFSSVARV